MGATKAPVLCDRHRTNRHRPSRHWMKTVIVSPIGAPIGCRSGAQATCCCSRTPPALFGIALCLVVAHPLKNVRSTLACGNLSSACVAPRFACRHQLAGGLAPPALRPSWATVPKKSHPKVAFQCRLEAAGQGFLTAAAAAAASAAFLVASAAALAAPVAAEAAPATAPAAADAASATEPAAAEAASAAMPAAPEAASLTASTAAAGAATGAGAGISSFLPQAARAAAAITTARTRE